METTERKQKNTARRAAAFLLAAAMVIACAMPAFAASTAYSADKCTVRYNGSRISGNGYYIKNTPYLPVDLIGTYAVNGGVTVDKSNLRLIVDVAQERIRVGDDKTSEFISAYAGSIYIPLRNIDGTLCFPLNVTDQLFKLGYSVSNGVISLHRYSGTDRVSRVNYDTNAAMSLLTGGSGYVSLSAGDQVYITGETQNYYRVDTIDSESCYVMKNAVTTQDVDMTSYDMYFQRKNKAVINSGSKIAGTWEYVNTTTPDAPSGIAGIDVLAPTWFSQIVNGDGNIANRGDRGYTDACHAAGYSVWATINNSMSTTGSTKYTTAVLADDALMKKTVAQYLLYSCMYNVDGINIDYEDVADADAANLVNFVKTMRSYTERLGLALSIDTMPPATWTKEYDYAKLADNVDLLIIMTYDEHYSGSKTAGSVSSLPWTEASIRNTILAGVPASKLMIGIPFYTREWTTDSSNNVLSQRALNMVSAQNVISSKGLSVAYHADTGQNYVEYQNGENTVKIWLEDETSIANRLDLVSKYDLAGCMCWRRGQEDASIWNVFAQKI